MGYYWTIVDDLPSEQIVVMRPGNFPIQATTPWAAKPTTEKSPNGMGEQNGNYIQFNLVVIIYWINRKIIKNFDINSFLYLFRHGL